MHVVTYLVEEVAAGAIDRVAATALLAAVGRESGVVRVSLGARSRLIKIEIANFLLHQELLSDYAVVLALVRDANYELNNDVYLFELKVRLH